MSERAKDAPAKGGRRVFLKALGLGAVAAAGGAGVPEAGAMRARPDQRAPRYRETDHVRKFYETNRR